MKIMVIVDKLSLLYKGYGNIIDEMLETGHEVICISADNGPNACDVGSHKNLKFYFIPHNGRNYIAVSIKFIIYCLMVYKVLKPDRILLYLNKHAINAGLMFRFFRGTPIFVIADSLKLLKGKKAIFYKRVYRYILSRSKVVFFAYKDDFDLIDGYKLGCKERALMLKSRGVDMNSFAKFSMPKTDLVYMSMPVLCCHGIKCFIETARLVSEKYPKVRFLLSGKFSEDPSVLSFREFDEACENGIIYYIDEVDDIRPYLEVCSIYMQPNMSVREGHIIEAEAAGRPILASDNPVNRSLVIEGYNEFILPVNEAGKWADKIILLLENKELKANMADYSHELCGRWHDKRKINKTIMENLERSL